MSARPEPFGSTEKGDQVQHEYVQKVTNSICRLLFVTLLVRLGRPVGYQLYSTHINATLHSIRLR